MAVRRKSLEQSTLSEPLLKLSGVNSGGYWDHFDFRYRFLCRNSKWKRSACIEGDEEHDD